MCKKRKLDKEGKLGKKGRVCSLNIALTIGIAFLSFPFFPIFRVLHAFHCAIASQKRNVGRPENRVFRSARHDIVVYLTLNEESRMPFFSFPFFHFPHFPMPFGRIQAANLASIRWGVLSGWGRS